MYPFHFNFLKISPRAIFPLIFFVKNSPKPRQRKPNQADLLKRAEKECQRELFIPDHDFSANLVVIQNNGSQKILSDLESGIILRYEKDECLQILTTNGDEAEPMVLEAKKSHVGTYETVNIHLKRGSRFGEPIGANSRLFVFDLVSEKKRAVTPAESNSPLDFKRASPEHGCYRFLVFFKKKTVFEILTEKYQTLMKEGQKAETRLNQVEKELKSIEEAIRDFRGAQDSCSSEHFQKDLNENLQGEFSGDNQEDIQGYFNTDQFPFKKNE